MEVIVQKINNIGLTFTQDYSNGVNDIEPLISSLRKFKDIVNKPGFGNKFSSPEKKLWNDIFTQLLHEEKPNGVEKY